MKLDVEDHPPHPPHPHPPDEFDVVGAPAIKTTLVGEPTFQTRSAATTFSVFDPSTSAGDISQDQLPKPPTVVVHVSQSGPVTTIVAHTSPVHVTVGVVSLTYQPPVGEVITGAAGETVSTVIFTMAGVFVFPARSVATILRAFPPSANAGDISQDQLPEASTVVVHVSQSGPVTTIVAHTSPVHVMVGVVSFVELASIGAITIRGVGAVESTVKVVVAIGDTLPAASVVVTFSVLLPSGRATVGVKL